MAGQGQPSLLAAFIGLDLAARMNRRRSLHGALDDPAAPAESPFLGSDPAVASAEAEAQAEDEPSVIGLDLVARMNRLYEEAPHIAYTSSGFGGGSEEQAAEVAATRDMTRPPRVTDDTVAVDARAAAQAAKAAPLANCDDTDNTDDARNSSFADQGGKKAASKLAASTKTDDLLTKAKAAGGGGVPPQVLSLLLERSPPPALLHSHAVAYDVAVAPLPPQQVDSPRQQLLGSPRPPHQVANSPRTGGGPAASPRSTTGLQRSALAAPSLHTARRDSAAYEESLEAAMGMMAAGTAAAFVQEGPKAVADGAAIDLLIQDLLEVSVVGSVAAAAGTENDGSKATVLSSATKRSAAVLQADAPEPAEVASAAAAEVAETKTPSPPAKRAFRTVEGLVVKLVPSYSGSGAAAPACSGTTTEVVQAPAALQQQVVNDGDLDAAIAAELCNGDADDDGELAGGSADGLLGCNSAMRKRKAEMTVRGNKGSVSSDGSVSKGPLCPSWLRRASPLTVQSQHRPLHKPL